MYHVIDQWDRYKDNLLKIVMPPYEGLGVYGGILTGLIAVIVIMRLWKQPFWKWADVIAPGLFVMQAIGRMGELLQPGAIRAADRPAVGHRHRLRAPRGAVRMLRAVPADARASSRCSCTSR